MSKKRKNVPLNESGYDLYPEDKDTVAEYLGFTANGMTDNEKIDDMEYFEEFLDERD